MVLRAVSKNKKPIRLTDERWTHITEEHSELAGRRLDVLETIEDPERIVLGNDEELLAIRTMDDEKMLVAVYREKMEDGFVITAFLTRRKRSFEKRNQIWP